MPPVPEILLGFLLGAPLFLIVWAVLGGIYTVEQNERAVVTSFGRAVRMPGRTSLDEAVAGHLDPEHRERYTYPRLKVIGPGGPYLKRPWQKVHKVNVAIRTVSIAFDPEDSSVNAGGTMLDAVTKDQLNIRITGQLRYRVCEENIYAYLFGVKNPEAHLMGYFISVLRERIANFEAPRMSIAIEGADGEAGESIGIEGVSINDLRKNLNSLNDQMERECLSSAARYGIVFDASLITGIDPPSEIESALAAINTAHNEVSADLSVAHAMADQRIEQSKRAVEIETMRAEAEVEPLRQLASQLDGLQANGPEALDAYLRNVRLDLVQHAGRVIRERGRA